VSEEYYIMKKACGCIDGAALIRNGKVSQGMAKEIGRYLRDGGSVEKKVVANSVTIPPECNHLILTNPTEHERKPNL
jgi:hypothetical protein